jgi:hypothetical protein
MKAVGLVIAFGVGIKVVFLDRLPNTLHEFADYLHKKKQLKTLIFFNQ